MVENGDSYYLNVLADCQEAFAYIQEPLILPQEIFVEVPLVYKTNYIKLVNPSNLDISFEWIDKNEKNVLNSEFIPSKGIIKAKSDTLIRYNIIYYSSKLINIYF